MPEGRERESGDAEVVRRRLDAVLGHGNPSRPVDDLDDLDDLGDLDEVEGEDDDDVPPRRRAGAHRARHVEDGDLAEGLGLWPQLVGAVADRVPVAVRHGRWGLSGSVVAAVLVVAAVVVLVLAVRSSAGAPGVPVPVRGASTTTSAVPTATSGAGAAAAAAPAVARVRGGSTPGPSPVAVRPAPASTAPAAPSVTAEVVVHVVGQVVRAGVVRLPAGSRVADAVDAAGGAAPDADLARVNLARLLVDGEQVVLPAPGEELAGPPPQPSVAPAVGSAPGTDPGTGGAEGVSAGPLDLNTATEADLDALPGIGPVLAQRILDVRTQLGAFTTVEELGEVSGIGEARLSELRDLVVVG